MNKLGIQIEQELRRQFGQLINAKQTERSLLLLQGILESKTVNLQACAESLSRLSDIEKSQKQLYAMFLDHFQTGKYDKLLKSYFLVVFHLTFHLCDGQLVMDRTEWQVGDEWHNLLVLGYTCRHIFIPLVWLDLGQRKNSNTEERKLLITRLKTWWKATKIPIPPLVLYADREFIGSEWFHFLVDQEIAFVIRLKKNQKFKLWHKGQLTQKAYKTEVLARYLRRYQLKYIEIVVGDDLVIPFCTSYTNYINLETKKTRQKAINTWFLAATIDIDEVQHADGYYNERWSVETAFGHTKSKGLNLEDFNLCGSHKLEIMFGLVSILYALAIRQAIEENLDENVEMKNYKNGKRYPAKSVFKLGFERIRKIVRCVKELFLLILKLFDQVFELMENKKYILKKSIVQ